MTVVQQHYDNHLGPIYAWSTGGIDAAMQRGEAELKALGVNGIHPQGLAVDLGAGFGAHTIPLAHAGWRVLAIDSCNHLLDELRQATGTLPIQCIKDDLLTFDRYLDGPVDLILCMGDTLTHLSNISAVESLIQKIAHTLAPNGRFIATLRDYSVERTDLDRFIPVRFDDDRLLTCVLEYRQDKVVVHDLLHTRTATGWTHKVSSYMKLRLSPNWVMSVMKRHGLSVASEQGPAGMMRLKGRRKSKESV